MVSWSGNARDRHRSNCGDLGAVPKRYLFDVRGTACRHKRWPHLVSPLLLCRIESRIRDGNQLRRREFAYTSRRDAEARGDDPK